MRERIVHVCMGEIMRGCVCVKIVVNVIECRRVCDGELFIPDYRLINTKACYMQ